MRKFLISLLLRPNEKVVNTATERFNEYNRQSASKLLVDVNRRLALHRRYCTLRRIDYKKIEESK